jgi:hypothetical protein
MKKLLSFAIVLLISSSALFAQSIKEEIEYYQSLFGMEKKGVVASFLELDEKDAFWEMYDEYETLRKELGQKRLKTLFAYADHYEDLTDEKTDQLIKESIATRNSVNTLIAKYYKKAKKISGSKTAAQFYQIENYFINAISSQLYITVPLIGELE